MRAVNHRSCKYRWKDRAEQTTEKRNLPSNVEANAATMRYEGDAYASTSGQPDGFVTVASG